LSAQGLFRTDLFYRLSGVEIHVPPLRSRPDDILELARYFLARHRHAHDLVLSDAAAEALRLYHWPGNVRELERLIERAIALAESSRIELDDLPPQVRGEYALVLEPSVQRVDTMRAWGSRYAQVMFERCGRNMRRTCQTLGISYHTLDAYLRYGRHRTGGRRKIPAWVKRSQEQQELRGSGE
jgi:DNA-binding NtrC family response regulator